MISGHAIPHHICAGGSQPYVSFASGYSDSTTPLNSLQSYLASVQSWKSMNKMKLNPDKTEFLLIGNERQRSKYLSMFPVELFSVKIFPAKSAQNVGVIFDESVTYCSHTSSSLQLMLNHMWDLWRVRRRLDLDSAKVFATALVSSRLDYCNSVLSGIADTDLTKLQLIHNRLACIVKKSPPFTHTVPQLRSFH